MYVLISLDATHIKVGYTTRPKARLKSYSDGLATDLEGFFYISKPVLFYTELEVDTLDYCRSFCMQNKSEYFTTGTNSVYSLALQVSSYIDTKINDYNI